MISAIVWRKRSPERKVFPQVYDGDTPSHLRSSIRKIRVLLTNPDMLHTYPTASYLMGRFHPRSEPGLIDEIHVYRGVFGSHITNLIRRLKQICAFTAHHRNYHDLCYHINHASIASG